MNNDDYMGFLSKVDLKNVRKKYGLVFILGLGLDLSISIPGVLVALHRTEIIAKINHANEHVCRPSYFDRLLIPTLVGGEDVDCKSGFYPRPFVSIAVFNVNTK